jgi:glutamyl-tRNA synthetase
MRAKLDMSSDNGCLRDPVCYRANDTPHHRTGTKFKAYPTYDFACPIVDAIEGVTHCLRSTEFNDRNPQYHALQEMLGVRHVRIWEYGKLQFVYTVLSKRKLQWFVDKGIVPDWNDPRFPTVQGCVRRGVTMSALRKFIYAQGASRNIVLQEWDKFWSVNKEEFEPSAPRYFGVAKKGAVTLTLSGGDADLFGADDCEVAAKTVACVPSNESLGKRPMRLGQSVVLEAEDAATCKVGDKIILLWWGVVEITAVVVDDSSGGGLTKLEGVRLPEVKPSSKMKQKFNWVCSDEDVVEAQIVEFDHLITKPKIEEVGLLLLSLLAVACLLLLAYCCLLTVVNVCCWCLLF